MNVVCESGAQSFHIHQHTKGHLGQVVFIEVHQHTIGHWTSGHTSDPAYFFIFLGLKTKLGEVKIGAS